MPKSKKTGKANAATKKKNPKAKKGNEASKSDGERQQYYPECASTSQAKPEDKMEESEDKTSQLRQRMSTSDEEGQEEPPLKRKSMPEGPEETRSIGQISITPAPSTGDMQGANKQGPSSSQGRPEEKTSSHAELHELVKHLQLASDLRMLDESQLAKQHGCPAIWVHTQTGKIKVTEPDSFKQFLKTTEAKPSSKSVTTTESEASTSTPIELSVIKASAHSEGRSAPGEAGVSGAQLPVGALLEPRRVSDSEESGDSDSSGESVDLWVSHRGKLTGKPPFPIKDDSFRLGLADLAMINQCALKVARIIILGIPERWDFELKLGKLHQHVDPIPASESYLFSKKKPPHVIRFDVNDYADNMWPVTTSPPAPVSACDRYLTLPEPYFHSVDVQCQSAFKSFEFDGISRDILDDELLNIIAERTNSFAESMRLHVPLLDDWVRTEAVELKAFFFTQLMMMDTHRIEHKVKLSDFFGNYLALRLLSPKRYYQLSYAWRLKDPNQTPEQFVDYASELFNRRFQSLLKHLPDVLSIQTYRLDYLDRSKLKSDIFKPRGTSIVSILKSGRYVLKMLFHTDENDTDMSGTLPTAGLPMLESLIEGIPIAGKYVLMAYGATLQAADFFDSKGALFIGSVGEQPYRLVDPEFDRLPVPRPPRTAYYLEPRKGIREVILLREYSRDPNCPFFIGLPTTIFPHMHLLCNIGGSQETHAFVRFGPVRGLEPVLVPLNLGLVGLQGVADRTHLAHHHVYGRALAGCCMAWHQRVLLHMMFTGFVNGWVANSAFTGRYLERPEAVNDIVHRMILRISTSLWEDDCDSDEPDWTSSDEGMGEAESGAQAPDAPAQCVLTRPEESPARAGACGSAGGPASGSVPAAAPVQPASTTPRRVQLQPGRASPLGVPDSQRSAFANAVELERAPE